MPSADRRLSDPTGRARISVIIPVWKEGQGLADTIDHLMDVWGRHPMDVIAVDGHPDGTTIRRLPKTACCRAVISPRGRARQMNFGASLVNGDILLFLHADTRLPDAVPELILAAMAAPQVAGGAFDLAIDAPGPAFRIIERTASLRSRITRIPFGDQALFVRRHIFNQMGGFEDIPLFEDVALMRRLRRDHRRIAFVPPPHRVRTSARRWLASGIVHTTLRNWALQLGYGMGISPAILAKYYR